MSDESKQKLLSAQIKDILNPLYSITHSCKLIAINVYIRVRNCAIAQDLIVDMYGSPLMGVWRDLALSWKLARNRSVYWYF